MNISSRPNAIMQAAVFHGAERITIERVAMPDVGAGEVLVRVSRTALCGSDFKLWHKGAEFTAGHEIFGVVEQPGHRLHGRRCAVYIPLHCGHCAACKRGDTQMCLEVSSLIGWNRPGGYAEYVPVPENCLLPVPDDIEDSLAPLLLDTIGTSGHAVRFVSRVVPASEAGPVLVMGAGPVGLGVVLALRALGYDDIYVADPNAARLKIAQSFGAKAHPVGDTSRRFALIMECSGAHAARNLGIELVLPRGALVLVGENAAPWTIEEGKVFRRKDFYMIRTFYFPVSDFEPNVELLRKYKDEYRVLVDGEFGLQALPENFARFAKGELIKPVLALD
ncbi:zinc-binding dehydrogenase [Bradyrhizobium sp.]|jgi:threonine dehydrogenase-like Zn-dependent dehydrogenase|uniref:zinc-dependent alcohol dehydrogenase family protein n=1 Tax=Bradyrhizobium sp. TaxID=376 RepID=UPI002DDD4D3B|nr:zinc-binding dehydrogenase [Bradyrhizobium sp.]HEV2154323.1 zinc-binding dehydrogenase [Bradyrhizobium sp.]